MAAQRELPRPLSRPPRLLEGVATDNEPGQASMHVTGAAMEIGQAKGKVAKGRGKHKSKQDGK